MQKILKARSLGVTTYIAKRFLSITPYTKHQQRQVKKAVRKVKRECTNKQILSQLRRSLQTPEQKRTRRMLLRMQTGVINGTL